MGQALLQKDASGDDALDVLASAALFRCLDRRRLRQLAPRYTRVRVHAGEYLLRRGENGDALYVVVHGRLRALLVDEAGERVLGEVGRGETVGEMAVLTGETRLSSVVAVRDSELIRLERAEFERLAAAEPRLMFDLARVLIARYRDALGERPAAALRTIAVVPLHADARVHAFALDLVRALRTHRSRVLHVGAASARAATGTAVSDSAALSAWMYDLEQAHELVVYEAEAEGTPWTDACLRQADAVLLVAAADVPPTAPQARLEARSGATRPRTELVLLHEHDASPSGTAAWLNALAVHAHYHLTAGSQRAVQRLARCLLGEAVGLVLGGGGARGLAHIGVLRALHEAGIPIDRIGGTSAGAHIAAMHALGWDWQRILAETRRTFVDRGSLHDYTLPVHALLRGARYRRIGDELYGDARIEDMKVPYFCVSTNLTRGEAHVHRAGLIRRAVRASMTVPGIAPAVFEGREVLVDGGVINNLPVDVMRALGGGAVIAVNISPRQELRLDDDYADTPSPWRSLFGRAFGAAPRVPTIGSILTRAVTLPRSASEADPRRQPDLLLEPPVARFRLLQWSAIDALAEIGYRHALERLEQWEQRPRVRLS